MSSATLFLSTMVAPCHMTSFLGSAIELAVDRPGVVISEFYPCGLSSDEYFVIENGGEANVSIANWSVTDGEGALRFGDPCYLPRGSRIIVSSNGTSYERAFGSAPDIALDELDNSTHVSLSGTFRLADRGDSMCLLDQEGAEIDFLVYGACDERGSGWTGDCIPSLRKGEVARRCRVSGDLLDSDRAADWLHFREFRYGYTEFSPVTQKLGSGQITAFASPDSGLSAVLEAIGSARTSLRLCSYELSSPSVCSALLSAIESGVSVRLLLDGAPAGGMAEGQITCLSVLARQGADVRVIAGNISGDAVQHVGPLHAKYLVVDGHTSVVLSENFVESGLPSNPLSGNRGWGLTIADDALAGYLKSVFDCDSRPTRPDVRAWVSDPRFDPLAVPAVPPSSEFVTGVREAMTTTSESVVTMLLSPDSSLREPFLCDLLGSSSHLVVEQFQADLLWKDRWTGESYLNPLLSSAEEALAGGAQVSLLLDSTWFNTEDNKAFADHFNAFALSSGLTGEARLMDLTGPVSTLHNKGLVSDGVLTLVSSNNWGYSSFARNRELAVLVRSEEVAEYFSSIFFTDWEPDRKPPIACAGPDVRLRTGESIVLDGSSSSDDRAVVRWEWSLEGDGLLTQHGSKAVFVGSRPGEQIVHLIVQDAWGNTGIDFMTVTVSAGGEGTPWPGGRWLLSSAVLLGIASSALGAAAARKVNHRNRSSR